MGKVLLLGLVIAVGCGSVHTEGSGGATTSSSTTLVMAVCIADTRRACACPDGGEGTQVCNASGTGYGACAGCT